MTNRAGIDKDMVTRFLRRHRLPESFRSLVDAHYVPLVSWLRPRRQTRVPLVLGINGAQGTGKSTLADFLEQALAATDGWRVAVLSIDDFYLTRDERRRLGQEVHPLLVTRGVPGTHDLGMLSRCLDDLRSLGRTERLRLPRFDKSRDDRADQATWPVVAGPVNLVILEGWCVGSGPEQADALVEPVNELEANEDPDGRWRCYINDQLAGGYSEVFASLGALVFLKVPDFDCVFRWRLEQEEKLMASTGNRGAGLMNRDQVARFIQHFERVTRANLAVLPHSADVVMTFDAGHQCVDSRYRQRP